MKKEKRLNAAIYLFLILISIIVLFPVYWLITTSFKTNIDIFSLTKKFSFTPSFINYERIFTTGFFPQYFKNSFIIGIASTALSLFIGFPAAYSLTRLKFRGKKGISLLILAGRMLPPVALIVPLYLIMLQFRLLNTLFSIMIVHTTITLPFAIWMLRSYFQSIPIELEEAAFLDGAGRFMILYKIIAPISLPGVLATAIFSFVESWNEYIFALILASTPKAQTLPVGVAGFITARGVAWGELSAAGTLMIIPVIFFSIYMQKYLRSGSSFFSSAMK